MVTATLLAGALLWGAPPMGVALLAVGMWSPWWGLGALGSAAIVAAAESRRGSGDDAEVRFLSAVAGELRAGESLRSALQHAAEVAPELDLAHPVRLAQSGAPMHRLGQSFRSRLPTTGELVAPAISLALHTGAAPATMVDRMAVVAATEREARRERRVLSAQARTSALVVGMLPFVVVVFVVVTGRAATLLAAGPLGAAVMAVGGVLLITGLVLVVRLTRRRAGSG